jgi:arsenate reductase
MAEGLLRRFGGDRFDVESAGTEPSRVHPLALRVMQDRDVDISGHRSKHLDEFRGARFDFVVTVCDQASESCPVFPGAPERIHWSIPDPSAQEGTDKQRLAAFERAADDLTTRIRHLIDLLDSGRKS